MGFLDILFPKRCVGCGEKGFYFCKECFHKAKLHYPQVCSVCEKPSIDGFTHYKCRTKHVPDRLLAIWNFEGSIKKLIYKLKYKFVSDVAYELGSKIGGFVIENKLKRAIIVPIPLHRNRENWRGFDHIKEVGDSLAKSLSWELVELLEKQNETLPQVGLSEGERVNNVKGVFKIKEVEGLSKDRPILLLDDVWTSGATLKEATRVFKRAGYKEIVCLTVAR